MNNETSQTHANLTLTQQKFTTTHAMYSSDN